MGRVELTSDISFSWFLSPEQLQRQKSLSLAWKAPGLAREDRKQQERRKASTESPLADSLS